MLFPPSIKRALHRSSLALAIASALMSTATVSADNAAEAEPVEKHKTGAPAQKFQQAQDMRYGAALYHYFQGNSFEALSTLMVSDLRGGIRYHADNADLIRGGISLTFGLEQQAAELFEKQLLKAGEEDQQERLARYREIAWLKLAELNYRHQDWDTAAQQLEKSGAMHQSALTLNLAIRRGDLQQARQLLNMADLPVAERALALSNLAAAQARSQQFEIAAQDYRRAALLVEQALSRPDMSSESEEELRILRDKARIGAGYAMALSGDLIAAAEEFRGVRLDTPWSADALLGLGWASVNGGNHQQAVDALGYLIRENPLSPQVQEALLALPFSYEQLRRPKLALRAYQNAERKYEQALDDLHKLHSAAAHLQFAEVNAESDIELRRYGWLEDATTPALIRMNQQYLLQMMQSDRLQLQLSELRDLRHLDRVLEQWQERLPELHTLIDEREQRRIDIVQRHSSAQYDQQVQIAEQELAKLKRALARIEADADGLAMLATSDSEAAGLFQMVREAEARYARLMAAGKTSNYQQQTLARARGILQWQAAEQYHDNLWQKRKAITSLEQELTTAARRERKVARIAAEAPQLNLLAGSVDDAGLRLQQQRNTIHRASSILEARIREDMRTALVQATERVEQYMAHTRLAIARIQDAAMQGMYDLPPEIDTPSVSGAASAPGDMKTETGSAPDIHSEAQPSEPSDISEAEAEPDTATEVPL
ncbi:tetratricopeptide repeat protein [Microbulbifer pacificus]|uniref:tetratricopeptide repeat protein n=1 Tax=Microbulbifer pacificus TaxID=407164 RepID=UPI000CF4C698|nr:hypothetical protein [Microbulbifer pacificus]